MSESGVNFAAPLYYPHSPAELTYMESSGDPQVVSLARRTHAFGEQLRRDSENIRALRRDLDALWVSRSSPDGAVVWVLRQRRAETSRRSA